MMLIFYVMYGDRIISGDNWYFYRDRPGKYKIFGED